ncbi:MAG: XTP/dITP diphosphatase [Candidatus Omnitrophota bacterium]|nr:XTP/dITP diphosphatase [Candidatus Omnitrophota bacterium]
MELVIATRNKKKMQEIEKILEGFDVKILSLENYPRLPEIVEKGSTFEDNAVEKSRVVARFTNQWALADDSGLEVEALDGRPGVYSARFAGKEQNDQANIKKLLNLMKNIPEPERTARFSCVMAISKPDGETAGIVKGICKGSINFKPDGKNGFGYDPIFIASGYQETFARMEAGLKNRISHRAEALRQVKEFIPRLGL